MGNKINPNCNRVFINNNWLCKNTWENTIYVNKIYNLIKKAINKRVGENNYEEIYLEYTGNIFIITIFTIKPGYVIGKKGINIKYIKEYILKEHKKRSFINIKEVFLKENSFSYFFENISKKIRSGISHKFFIRNTIKKIKIEKGKGIKIEISGRINGAEIAKNEKYIKGSIPNNTMIKNIVYKEKKIKTKYGIINIKIWLNN